MACMCGVCMWYVYGRLSSRFVYPWSSFSTRRTISGPTRIVIRSAPPRSPLLVARFRFCPAAAGGTYVRLPTGSPPGTLNVRGVGSCYSGV